MLMLSQLFIAKAVILSSHQCFDSENMSRHVNNPPPTVETSKTCAIDCFRDEKNFEIFTHRDTFIVVTLVIILLSVSAVW